ncbi:FMN-linked oxidoreductase [Clavulina sp. PMI_390]|nr:FMN-linked oxidoreductase [Clavulina sp. PMI_390]
MSDAEILGASVSFPSGRVSLNRFVKAPLYEALSNWYGGPPNDDHYGLYRLWAAGEWGMILTGNVQVSKRHLSLGRDMVVPQVLTEENIAPFQRLANAIHTPWSSPSIDEDHDHIANPQPRRSLAIMQLSHAGRQSGNVIGGRAPFAAPLGASDIPMKSQSKNILAQAIFPLIFTPPRAASDSEIEDVIGAFVRGAELSVKAGFDGVELHCSHGYLLAQFMSPKTNNRAPPYGPASSLHLLRTIISKTRAVIPPEHLFGLKLNASDYVKGGLTEEDALEQLRVIAGLKTPYGRTCIDFVEISGGDYETPAFLAKNSRQAYFASFSRQALETVEDMPNAPRIVLTGGFTSTDVMVDSVRQNHTQLVSIGRASIADPFIPRRFLSPSSGKVDTSTQPEAETLAPVPRSAWWSPPDFLINMGIVTMQWTALMHRRAAQGQDMMNSDAGAIPLVIEDWHIPLTAPSQHAPPFRSLLQGFIKRDQLRNILFVAESLSVFALAVFASFALRLIFLED